MHQRSLICGWAPPVTNPPLLRKSISSVNEKDFQILSKQNTQSSIDYHRALTLEKLAQVENLE